MTGRCWKFRENRTKSNWDTVELYTLHYEPPPCVHWSSFPEDAQCVLQSRVCCTQYSSVEWHLSHLQASVAGPWNYLEWARFDQIAKWRFTISRSKLRRGLYTTAKIVNLQIQCTCKHSHCSFHYHSRIEVQLHPTCHLGQPLLTSAASTSERTRRYDMSMGLVMQRENR